MLKYQSNCIVLAIAGLFYLFTLAPTVIGGDSAAFCLRVHRFALHFGRADDHPLHTVLGKVFSFLPFELAYNLNLMSAFFGALTVYFIFLTIQYIAGSPFAAFFGSLSLMVSHAFWLHSVIAEVYTLNTFFLALLVYLAITKINHTMIKILWPIIFFLGLLNHLVLMISLPAFLIYFLINAEPKERRIIIYIIGIVCAFIIFITLWLYVYRCDSTLKIIKSYLKGPPSIFHYLLPPNNLFTFLKEIGFYILYLIYQYPVFGILIGGIGILQLFRKDKKISIFLLMLILLNGLFFIKTTSWKSLGGTKYTFYIPDYTIFAIFLGYGSLTLFQWAGVLSDRLRPILKKMELRSLANATLVLLFILSTVVFYAAMPRIVSNLDLDLVHARTLPYRDNDRYFLHPNKRGYYGDKRLGIEILRLAKPNSIIFADFTIDTILGYLKQINGMRPDINIVNSDRVPIGESVEKIKKENPGMHIYIADDNDYYDLNGIGDKYLIDAIGPFFELVPKERSHPT